MRITWVRIPWVRFLVGKVRMPLVKSQWGELREWELYARDFREIFLGDNCVGEMQWLRISKLRIGIGYDWIEIARVNLYGWTFRRCGWNFCHWELRELFLWWRFPSVKVDMCVDEICVDRNCLKIHWISLNSLELFI